MPGMASDRKMTARGFTLIELLVVIALVGIITSCVRQVLQNGLVIPVPVRCRSPLPSRPLGGGASGQDVTWGFGFLVES